MEYQGQKEEEWAGCKGLKDIVTATAHPASVREAKLLVFKENSKTWFSPRFCPMRLCLFTLPMEVFAHFLSCMAELSFGLQNSTCG